MVGRTLGAHFDFFVFCYKPQTCNFATLHIKLNLAGICIKSMTTQGNSLTIGSPSGFAHPEKLALLPSAYVYVQPRLQLQLW